jgi:hypothetical protein
MIDPCLALNNVTNHPLGCLKNPYPGQYQPSTGQTRCLPCPSGKHTLVYAARHALSLSSSPTYNFSNRAASCQDNPPLQVVTRASSSTLVVELDNSAGLYNQVRITLGKQIQVA